MKIKILNEFYDKNSNKLYKKGEILEFDNKRANEILSNRNNLTEIYKDNSCQTSRTSKKRKKQGGLAWIMKKFWGMLNFL